MQDLNASIMGTKGKGEDILLGDAVALTQLDKAIGTHKKGEIFKVWTPAGLHIVTLKDNPKQGDGYALFLRVFL